MWEIVESGSGILSFGIHNSAQGIRNTVYWNPKTIGVESTENPKLFWIFLNDARLITGVLEEGGHMIQTWSRNKRVEDGARFFSTNEVCMYSTERSTSEHLAVKFFRWVRDCRKITRCLYELLEPPAKTLKYVSIHCCF